MSAPAVIIRLELEHRPVVYADCVNKGEEVRLLHWLDTHDALGDLVARALEIAAEERAA